MPHKDEEVDEMPYANLQGDLGPLVNDLNSKIMKHTEDITRLKTQNENIFLKLDGMESKVDGIGDKIDDGNSKNEKIFNQLLDHHLSLGTTNNKNRWKLVLSIVGGIVGGGGLLSVVIVAALQIVGGG